VRTAAAVRPWRGGDSRIGPRVGQAPEEEGEPPACRVERTKKGPSGTGGKVTVFCFCCRVVRSRAPDLWKVMSRHAPAPFRGVDHVEQLPYT